MAALPSLVPEGATDDIDLTRLTQDQRTAWYVTQLRPIAFYQGKDGVDAFKRRHPEADTIWTDIKTVAYAKKPPGYPKAVTGMVTRWFDSPAALASTNADDVQRLNDRFQTDRFDPASHFSKPLPPSLLREIGEVFRQRGFTFDPSAANTLSKVRAAARARQANTAPDAAPFGTIGSRTGETLTIGGAALRVTLNGKRECVVRVVEGRKHRLYLDDMLAFADLFGAGPSPCNGMYTTADQDYLPETPQIDPLADLPAPTSEPPAILSRSGLNEAAADPIDPEPLSLSDKIRRLAAALPAIAPAVTPGANPMELDPLEL